MAPDTAQNVMYTIYFLLLHNFLAIVYFIGVLVGIALSFWKPSRSYILIMLGFMTLLFAFQYSKHILEPLKEQTTNSLVTVRESPRIERIIHIVIARLVPLGLPILGWIMVISGTALRFLRYKKEKNQG